MLLERLNDPKLGDPDLAARLHHESDGNPFFLWSILHSLSEGECAVKEAGSLPLPDALRDSVRVRLARVPQEDRPLLEVAAVFGRRFDFETLLALTRGPEERFLRAMKSLVKRRLLREDQESGFYDFSHDKVREVVYRDIGTARRVLLHRALAGQIEGAVADFQHVIESARALGEHEHARDVLIQLGMAFDAPMPTSWPLSVWTRRSRRRAPWVMKGMRRYFVSPGDRGLEQWP